MALMAYIVCFLPGLTFYSVPCSLRTPFCPAPIHPNCPLFSLTCCLFNPFLNPSDAKKTVKVVNPAD